MATKLKPGDYVCYIWANEYGRIVGISQSGNRASVRWANGRIGIMAIPSLRLAEPEELI